MTSTGVPLLAGILSTVIFAASVLPMVVKAWRTRDLRSYSRSHLVLANVGNGLHSVYVFDLPPGPIWALHSFYLVSSALMLAWSVRYAGPCRSHDVAGRRFFAADATTADLEVHDDVAPDKLICCFADGPRLLNATLPAAGQMYVVSTPGTYCAKQALKPVGIALANLNHRLQARGFRAGRPPRRRRAARPVSGPAGSTGPWPNAPSPG